jgi:hypothetical protein
VIMRAGIAGLEIPSHIILAAKALTQADGLARTIDPSFTPARVGKQLGFEASLHLPQRVAGLALRAGDWVRSRASLLKKK